jgi:CDP-paratose 2-epimerase
MKLLVTGGCGFLGSNLAAHAIAKGYESVVFDSLYREGSIDNLRWLKEQGGFRFVQGDIRNQNDITRLVQEFKPDAIFHLAGQVAMTTSIVNPRMDFEVNALGTHNLLEAVRLYAPSAAVIYSSTNKVYGDLEQYNYRETETRYECIDKPNGFDETTPLNFHSPYGCSKGTADQYMLDYARIFGLKTVVFRHSSMYGGRQFATYDQGWIGWFCQKALETKRGILTEPFTISGNGKQVRDVLHAEDMKKLYFAAMDHIDQAAGQAFNIGGGIKNSLSILELFALLEELLDIRLTYTKIPWRQSDQKMFVADISKAERILHRRPQKDVSSGIVNMLDWVEESELMSINT